MHRHLLSALTLTAAAAATAQDTPADEGPWSGDIEFGYVSTSGNTETTSMKGRAEVLREVDKWRYNLHFDALNASEDGDRSAEQYLVWNKLDYKYSERGYLFGYASYSDDRFSGFDYQAVISAGWGYRILENENMTWDAEVGPGYRINKVSETNGFTEDDDREVILRGYTKYQWQISDSAKFTQELSVEAGSDNTISRSVTGLKANIIGALAMKLTYTVKYTENIPADNKHADTETAVTLVYTF